MESCVGSLLFNFCDMGGLGFSFAGLDLVEDEDEDAEDDKLDTPEDNEDALF